MTGKADIDFVIENFRGIQISVGRNDRLERQYRRIEASGKRTDSIRAAIDASLQNILSHGTRSFIIYGEPQSGKTEMMIALTAALLDTVKRIVIVLTNDNVQLLEQNLSRFQLAGLDPAPKNFSDILDPATKIAGRSWVIFAKKNQSDLTKLLEKIGPHGDRVVIDDEADYASPNARVNRAQKTRINELVEKLIGKNGLYIGVTATPARLDLNATFANENTRWVDFPPHEKYTGQEVFFPTTSEGLKEIPFRLVQMPVVRDDQKYLRESLFSFLVNVAYLNTSGGIPGNYSMLVHTSGKKADHTQDYKAINAVLGALSDEESLGFERAVRDVFRLAAERFPGQESELTTFVVRYINQHNIVLMNSNNDRGGYSRATTPATLFTIAIGGNIVSRGVTFDNLLSMFFTRDTAHQIQQDTYIQRARMFGNRGAYLSRFELYIPETLYADWQRCFVFHKLSLKGITEGLGAPLWLEDSRVKPATSGSIKRSAIEWRSGEMFWDIFDLTETVQDIVGTGGKGMAKLQQLGDVLEDSVLPRHVLDFISSFRVHGDESVALHPIKRITWDYKSADVTNVTREKGFIGASELEPTLYPVAFHHIIIFANPDRMARVYYKYAPKPGDLKVNGRKLAFMSRRPRG
ncbi:DNA helicase [Nakamurella silvestris]|nr:DNA helicase [Nakamurella silvestris]